MFPCIDGESFFQYKPLQNVHFKRSVACRFFTNCVDLLARTQGKKFEDVFFIKIANIRATLITFLLKTSLWLGPKIGNKTKTGVKNIE